ncbi:hypothetical protein ASPZODRAFT_19331 [Penicilliopsis zonata CBS 506.65]|uniref:Uncharacterized protein n=1 Tax=Penicilliopsis zonata CBS 506.65 TaxID=1073090 RepID=A0A1L9S8X0_9EURO|nr:hypothetical protein ASPZODRAFT_19331 [Penicilliopsis zonata CBS 506.65]OJJ43610.1 hypothetical protein ASPZODRAFT_19331 [Penicilliopsis zonata CBS 506.65]
MLRVFSLSLMLVALAAAQGQTQIHLTTAEESHSLTVPFKECVNLPEEPITALTISHKCVFFTHPECIGRAVELRPGDHSAPEPVEVASAYCQFTF